MNPGIMVISAPSGGGKTSLARELVRRRSDVGMAVSHTTRPQRPGEQDGVDYFFVDNAGFVELIDKGEFIEYARVFDNYYGTSIKALEKLISNGKHAILDIDWQGARNVRERFSDAVTVFVMPPSMEALENRLRERRQDSEAVIARRMRDAAKEMSHKDEFDIIITNDDFETTAEQLEQILETLGSAENIDI